MPADHELQREGIVTQDERGIGFENSTFAYFEGWKPEYRRYRFINCTFLNGFVFRPRRDGKPILLNMEAHDILEEGKLE